MRLEKIKLAGFKSFVDPTTLPLPGNLVGIVGPNGCGKSNLIDAVRWVMGESSAKHLRGENMADVIFNGSSSRKPVGMATVELVFDNTEGKAPGEYSSYQQISIKRQVTRDGQSTYLLNGTRCRRKDITDLFLGTGLGSRSYAIIEQGMISRLIEAKPTELRELIEEAAGISKYKERRHETELRMNHTQENLDRLLDIRNELGKNLENLGKQARKAEKFTLLRKEERLYKEQLLTLRWLNLKAIEDKHKSELGDYETAFRQYFDENRKFEEEQKNWRNQHNQLQNLLNDQQAQFYEVGSQITRIEQSITHARKSREELGLEQERVQREQARILSDMAEDQARINDYQTEMAELDLQFTELQFEEQKTELEKNETETALKEARQGFEILNADVLEYRKQVEIQKTKLRQYEQQERQLAIRVERLTTEQENLEQLLRNENLDDLQLGLREIEEERTIHQNRLLELQNLISTWRPQSREYLELLNDKKSKLHAFQGQASSLSTLQQHAMGKDRLNLGNWLVEQKLADSSRLAEHLEVQSGWEIATESVLGQNIEALCVEKTETYLPHLAKLKDDSIAFIESNTRNNHLSSAISTGMLLDKITSPLNLKPLIGTIYHADDLASAIKQSSEIQDHESIVTKDGIRVGKNWLSVQKPDDLKAGVIKREKELRELKTDISQLQSQIEHIEQDLLRIETLTADAERDREQIQTHDRRLAKEQNQLNSELSAATARCQETEKRLVHIEAELDELDEERIQINEEMTASRELTFSAEEKLKELEPLVMAQFAKRADSETNVSTVETRLKETRASLGLVISRRDSITAAEKQIERNLERSRAQLNQCVENLQNISIRITEVKSPVEDEQQELEALVELRTRIEKKLSDVRHQNASIEAGMRKTSELQMQNEAQIAKIKEKLEQTKLQLATNEVRLQSIQEQLLEMDTDPVLVADNLPQEADEKIWQTHLNQLAESIEKLGPVNLTAMEEYKIQDDRIKIHDQQCNDLAESLATLREAIDKIDKECRLLFKDTFDRVNEGLQQMFPKLFGGGQACLNLIERDLLESGVSIMARPPGKRNSSIQLLSGGEKALTAAALVFAIFKLNPAPFCLLDEVDAPLDEANVGRFSQLVKEMSEKVQFLFISHNKATMEIAQHLAGVTMKEPGVSRIVSVSIDAAVELASA